MQRVGHLRAFSQLVQVGSYLNCDCCSPTKQVFVQSQALGDRFQYLEVVLYFESVQFKIRLLLLIISQLLALALGLAPVECDKGILVTRHPVHALHPRSSSVHQASHYSLGDAGSQGLVSAVSQKGKELTISPQRFLSHYAAKIHLKRRLPLPHEFLAFP